MIDFNINHNVMVQLTDHGRKLYANFWNEYNIDPPNLKEDEDGWSKWQLWSLMETFGEHVGMCKKNAFSTTIRIDAPVGRRQNRG